MKKQQVVVISYVVEDAIVERLKSTEFNFEEHVSKLTQGAASIGTERYVMVWQPNYYRKSLER